MLLKKYGQLWFDKTCNMSQNALNGANDVTSYKDCKYNFFHVNAFSDEMFKCNLL